MAADMHIHILTDDFTKEHYKAFHSNCLGSDYFNPGYDDIFEKEHGCDLYELCSGTPNIWVGEVSWLKAGLFGDADNFIPDLVMKISEIVGENFPVIDENLISQIKEAFNLPNKTQYNLQQGENILRFLEENKGKECFLISW